MSSRACRTKNYTKPESFNKLPKDGLVVGHVTRGRAELSVGFDHFVDRFQKVLFRGDLSTSSNSEHAGFRAHTSDFSAC